MPDLAQIRPFHHQAAQFLFRGVGRAVIDINDLERPALQSAGNLGDERRYIAGLVTHRHDHGERGHVLAIPAGRIAILQHGASF